MLDQFYLLLRKNSRSCSPALTLAQFLFFPGQQTWSRLRNRDRKPSRFDSRSSRFRFEPIRVETSKSRFVIDFFNFDFGIYICMFSEKSVLFRYYRNVTDSYRKYVMTIKITVLLPIFFPPSLFHRFDTDVYNK
jgi:hypothetical protein